MSDLVIGSRGSKLALWQANHIAAKLNAAGHQTRIEIIQLLVVVTVGFAFGGDRQAILQAEGQRNLNTRLGDIQAQGLQSAFTNAQGQFNADQNRMGSNFSQAGSLGSTLAGIGQQCFMNQLAVNQGIMGIGNQQQALNQRGLDVGYQNFLDQRNQPYQQAQFMQSGLQGLPMTQTSTATMTSAPTRSAVIPTIGTRSKISPSSKAGISMRGINSSPSPAPASRPMRNISVCSGAMQTAR